ncbi:MAG: TRZ/ATZ family hydrolase [Zoogloeaceae bacterium]|jgi:5-methylthioadenosine/S-adenosylhomocysteine deaminase|nr:TRZ/ATZ family hydrolase [Zoogloeaceae bacterium]
MPDASTLNFKPDLLIHARWIALAHRETLLEQHAVAIADGRIIDILPSHVARERYDARETVTLAEHLLIPGLINLHTHAAMSLMRGMADDIPMMRWLQERIWPVERALVSPEFISDGTRLACAEMLLGGITCFNDMYFFPHAAAEAAVELGMRAVLGVTVLEFPSGYASDAADYLDKGLAALDAWREHPLINFCLAPHAPYSVSDASFEKIQILSAQLEVPVHVHIHETTDEIRQHLEEHGCRPLHRLNRLGLLGPQLIGVHAAHLLDDEIAALARNNCNVAHCPTSNLKLGCGIAPIGEMLAENINVGLGTDSAASNNRLDLLAEMRLASLLAKGKSGDASIVPAWKALQMATLAGARALGLERDIGSIEIGKYADLTAVRMDTLELSPCFDPVSHLIHCAGREDVSHVWVQGRCCVFDKTLLHCENANLKNNARLWHNRIVTHLQPNAT